MRIITRAEWGASHDNGSGSRSLPAREVWLHHSVTIAPDLVQPFDDDYAAIRELERIGESRFGRGISYTRLFTPVGLIFEGHSIGQIGSHTANRNSIACGYCLVGNYETGHPTREQLLAIAWTLQHDYSKGWITRPQLNGGHRDLKSTACPGKNAYALIGTINNVAAGSPIEENEEDMVNWDDKYKFHRTGQITEYSNWIGETNAAANAAVTIASRIEAKQDAQFNQLTKGQANLAAAIKAIPAPGPVTPEQLDQLREGLLEGLPDDLVDEFDTKLRDRLLKAAE